VNNKVVRMINNYTKKSDNDRKKRKGENRVVMRRMATFGGAMLLAAAVLILLAFNQKGQNEGLEEELAQTQAVMDERVQEEKDLQQRIKQLNDDNYISRIARSEFFLSEEDEIIFNLPEGDEEQENSTNETSE